MPVNEALQRAQDLTLDLVEVSPDSRPPVCRIMDFGKYKYEMSKKDKIAKKKQHIFQLKEMRYRPKIDDHDFDFKTKHLRTFLEDGSKVRVMVQFRGREMAHQEFGHVIMDRVLAALKDVANPEGNPKMEGNTLAVTLNPKAEVFKKAQASKTVAPKPAKPVDIAAKKEDAVTTETEDNEKESSATSE